MCARQVHFPLGRGSLANSCLRRDPIVIVAAIAHYKCWYQSVAILVAGFARVLCRRRQTRNVLNEANCGVEDLWLNFA